MVEIASNIEVSDKDNESQGHYENNEPLYHHSKENNTNIRTSDDQNNVIVPVEFHDSESNEEAKTKEKTDVVNGKPLGYKERIKQTEIPGGLTISSFVLLLVGSQNIWSLAIVLLYVVSE